jgi:hypothetical protein
LRRSVRTLAVWAALWVGAGTPGVAGQDPEGVPVRIDVVAETGALEVQLGDLLADGGLRRAIHQGLPLRVGVRAELWQDRFFDSQRAVAEWKASVVFDPVLLSYHVEVQDGAAETVGSLAAAAEALQRRFQLPIRPERPGRYYYLAIVEMETLSLSDLEELQRWLRGDLAPAVAGEQDVEGAVARGVRRLFVRALGLPTRRLRLRTPTFEFGGG